MKWGCLACVLVLGCGSVVAPGQHDGGIDGPDADLTDADLTGNLTVTTQTYFAGGGAIGAAQGMVDIVSLRPNETVADMLQTDASGHATVKAYPGGSVTAIYRHTADAGADLVTYMGVKPNDSLTFGKFWNSNDNTSLGSMTLSWPAYSGVSYYAIVTPCGYFTSTVQSYSGFTEYNYCHHTPMGVITAAFVNSGGNTVIGAMSYTVVNFTAGGTQALNGWVAAGNGTANITGLPPEVTNVGVYFTAIANGGQPGGSMFETYQGGQPTGGAATLTMPWANVGQRTFSQVYMYRQGQFSQMSVMDSLMTPTTTIASPELPPWVSGVIGSIPGRMMTWFPIGTTNQDGNVVQVGWSHMMGTTYSPFTWTFITPPEVSAFAFPKLPATFDDAQPHPEDNVNNYQVRLLKIPSMPGYDAFRGLPSAQVICPECTVEEGLIQRIIASD
jgi:hypothetical protein